MRPSGLVVMAYGTPGSPDEIEAYYTHIRRGRAPSPDQLAELVGRYEAIGGTSPLAARTRDQTAAIRDALAAAAPGEWVVELGTKHAPPFVEDAVTALARAGVERVVGLVLAPHYSRGSVGEYHTRAGVAAAAAGLAYAGVESWHDSEPWIEAQAARVRAALAGMPPATEVLFTAHSLPERVLEGDRYVAELEASARAIAARAGLTPPAGVGDVRTGVVAGAGETGAGGGEVDAGDKGGVGGLGTGGEADAGDTGGVGTDGTAIPAAGDMADAVRTGSLDAGGTGVGAGTVRAQWRLAWQSAGRTPEPWRGPDVAEVIRELGAGGTVAGVLVCPQGFTSDHLEVLYDLDIDARRVAAEAGLAFARTASINDEPAVMADLAARVRRVPVPS